MDCLDLPFLGVSEVAAVLGVSKQRVGQLASTAGFPAPAFRLAATPVWSREAIAVYALRRRTRPGPVPVVM